MDCQRISDLHMLFHTSYSFHVTNPNQYGHVTHMNMQNITEQSSKEKTPTLPNAK